MARKQKNTMIELKNIKKNEDMISCDVYPEDSTEAGSLLLDTSSGNYEYKLPKGYEWCRNHISHAVRTLVALNGSGASLPREKMVMWG